MNPLVPKCDGSHLGLSMVKTGSMFCTAVTVNHAKSMGFTMRLFFLSGGEMAGVDWADAYIKLNVYRICTFST